ncbi:MAG TPA: membrane dipeptidase [Povalibacter sp.]
MSTTHSADDAFFLDVTAPMIQPRELAKRIPMLRKGGIDAVLTSAAAIEDFKASMAVIGQWLEIDRMHRHGVRLARSVKDLRAAKVAGDVGVVLHFQGAEPIEDRLDFLDVFHASGLRVMQVTYNSRNRLGDGCFEPTDAGLSKFGRSVIQRMETLGIAVDLSHAGQRTALEAVEAATRPVVVTHANSRALFDMPRNVSDDLIRQVAGSGGVIGLCAVPFFLSRPTQPTLDTLIDHIVHVAELVGVQHVGLGFDFAEEDEDDYVYFGYDTRYIPQPPWIWPTGITNHADAGNVAPALRRRGFSEMEVRAILGENFLRVFGEIWRG